MHQFIKQYKSKFKNSLEVFLEHRRVGAAKKHIVKYKEGSENVFFSQKLKKNWI
jgi:hypothetical protein